MSKATFMGKMTFASLLLVILLANTVLAHNISWNKATLELKGDTLSLALRMVQTDLLGEVDPSRDSSTVLSPEKWNQLLPRIRKHVFQNVQLLFNGNPVTAVVDDGWRLDDFSSGGNADTLMKMIEISRAWKVTGSLHSLKFKPHLLENAGLPVKWVVLVFTDFTRDQRLYQVIRGDGAADFDFDKRTGVNNSPVPKSGHGKSSLWGRIAPTVSILCATIILLIFGAIMMRRFLSKNRL
jgi:hypothetical protein